MSKYVSLNKKIKQLAACRPFGLVLNQLIQDQLMLHWTYNSNAIEGNTLTYKETSFYLLRGLTAKGKSLEEHLEISNHKDAISFLENISSDKKLKLNEKLIREVHQILFKKIDHISTGLPGREQKIKITAGQYKDQDNHVLKQDGTIHYYVPALSVPAEMKKLIDWCNSQWGDTHPIELSAKFHYEFVRIHPFMDGNGRVARLLMNLILMNHNYPPAIIKNEEKEKYYEALEKADKGKIQPFVNLVFKEVEGTIDFILNIVNGKMQVNDKKHKLYFIRKEKKLTQKELSKLSGVEQATISKIENNKEAPQFSTLKSLSRAIKISIKKLE